MRIGKYFKRMFKYIISEHKQDIVYAQICQKKSSEIFNGKVAIITGGGHGIGFYIAKRLISDGAVVIITGRNEVKLKSAKKELGKNCEYIVMDVTNIENNDRIIKNIYKKYGKLDFLINNAGISLHEGSILDVTEQDYDNQFNTNLKASYFLSKSYINEYLKNKQKNGNIIFISSQRGSQCDELPYGLTKVAINSLTQCLGKKYYKKGIRVNAISPGVTASDLTKIDKNKDLGNDRSNGRYFVQEEIAEVVAFIASDYSKCMSGDIINCDGGEYNNTYF